MLFPKLLQSFIPLPISLWSLLAVASASVLPDCNGNPRFYELTLTWEKGAPDGFERDMIFINGQFPGPTLEINQGDAVEVLVNNQLPFNTTIHYHGIEMHETPWSDGVPGLSQFQIRPGGHFTYKWTATQHGSYFYHSHDRGQLDDGLYGPIVIHPKDSVEKPFSLISDDAKTLRAIEKAAQDPIPVVLSDWQHIPSGDRWDIGVAGGVELPCYDSFLINGKGRVDCFGQEKIQALLDPAQKQLLALVNLTTLTDKGCLPAEALVATLGSGFSTNLSAIPDSVFNTCESTEGSATVIEVTKSSCDKEKWVALDLIGTYGLQTTAFSIDEHSMYIYAVDGEYIEPQLVNAIAITNGDRYSVLIKLETPGDYSIRQASLTTAQMMALTTPKLSFREKGKAPHNNTSTPWLDDKGNNVTEGVVFFSQASMKPFSPVPISQTADQTFLIYMRVAGRAYNWALNESIFPMQIDAERPVLFEPQPYIENNITITTKNNTWIDLVFITATFPMPPHPIHKHGNKMYEIGAGTGTWNWTTVDEAIKEVPENFNLVDPPRRDGLATPNAITGPAWLVVRYHVTQPGAWLLHCHIQSHLLGGMSMIIQDGIDYWPVVPDEYLNYQY